MFAEAADAGAQLLDDDSVPPDVARAGGRRLAAVDEARRGHQKGRRGAH